MAFCKAALTLLSCARKDVHRLAHDAALLRQFKST